MSARSADSVPMGLQGTEGTEAEPVMVTRPCWHCDGTGLWRGTGGGECFFCRATPGFLTFDLDRRVSELRRQEADICTRLADYEMRLSVEKFERKRDGIRDWIEGDRIRLKLIRAEIAELESACETLEMVA